MPLESQVNLIVVRAAYDPHAKVWWVEDRRTAPCFSLLHFLLQSAQFRPQSTLIFTAYLFCMVLAFFSAGDDSVMTLRVKKLMGAIS
jgi:hypothetical protein